MRAFLAMGRGPAPVLPHLDAQPDRSLVGLRVRRLPRHQHGEKGLARVGRTHHAYLRAGKSVCGSSWTHSTTSSNASLAGLSEAGGREERDVP